MSDSPCRYRGPDGGVGETRHTSRHASKVKALVYVQCALSVSTRQSDDTARRCGPVRLRAVREHLYNRTIQTRSEERARRYPVLSINHDRFRSIHESGGRKKNTPDESV
jgi:hypothetical protein